MLIGLIDVDGHNFPNLALMRISAYHKAKGDEVEWWKGSLFHYDIVYKSKVFSDTYSKDVEEWINADVIISGGTGYAITTENGREKYDKSVDHELPDEIEKMYPDYSLYPKHKFAVAMTSRGCPRGCAFCHVAPKEGKCSRKVANLDDFFRGEFKHIEVLDPNITACNEKRDLFDQYARERRATITFSQGLDIRLLDSYDIEDLNRMRVKDIHFAWDNAKENLLPYFEEFKAGYKHRRKSEIATVYCLTNFNSTLEEALIACRNVGLEFDAVNDNVKSSKELFGNNSRKVYASEYWDDKSVNASAYGVWRLKE